VPAEDELGYLIPMKRSSLLFFEPFHNLMSPGTLCCQQPESVRDRWGNGWKSLDHRDIFCDYADGRGNSGKLGGANMEFFFKLLITNTVIVSCVAVGKKVPTLAGLIATMPLTSLLVLIWLHSDSPGDVKLLEKYTGGVLWGIIPTIVFFTVAFFCFRRGLPLPVTLSLSFAAWLAGAAVHQWLLR
jgi:uncharacterized membrane protein (GlpM family)